MPMKIYKYTDNTTKKVVFECIAENIFVAHDLMQKVTGIVPVLTPHIGCQVLPK